MAYITNRTAADVERWRYLKDKGWSGMTDTERKEWLGEIDLNPSAVRGMYTHNDLNRVENGVKNILCKLDGMGYTVPEVITKNNWSYKDSFWETDMARYYNNIKIVRGMVPVSADTPKAPKIGEALDHQVANDIEKILTNVEKSLYSLSKNWFYSGDLMVGEV